LSLDILDPKRINTREFTRSGSLPLRKWVEDLCMQQDQIKTWLRERLEQQEAAHNDEVDPEDCTYYNEGSLVLLAPPPDQAMTTNKLEVRYTGPYEVVFSEGNSYRIRHLVSQKESTVNVHRLKPYVNSLGLNDPFMAALRDNQEHIIERIIMHRDAKRLDNMSFMVKWLGEPLSESSWVPWRDIRNNVLIVPYFREHGLVDRLPKAMTTDSGNA